jgi:hypothetical protein
VDSFQSTYGRDVWLRFAQDACGISYRLTSQGWRFYWSHDANRTILRAGRTGKGISAAKATALV